MKKSKKRTVVLVRVRCNVCHGITDPIPMSGRLYSCGGCGVPLFRKWGTVDAALEAGKADELAQMKGDGKTGLAIAKALGMRGTG